MTSRTSKPGEQPADVVWSADELLLLEAARGDLVPPHLEQRMRDVLEGHIAQASPAAPSTSIRSSGLFGSKLALWGTLGVLALGCFAYLSASRSPDNPSGADPLASQNAATSQDGQAPRPSTATSAPSSTLRPAPSADKGLSNAESTTSSASLSQPRHAEQHETSAAASAASAPPTQGHAPVEIPAAVEGGARDSQQPRGTSEVGAKAAPLRAALDRSGSDDARAKSLPRRAAVDDRSSRIEQNAQSPRDAARLSAAEPRLAERDFVASDQLRIEAELLDAARRALGQGALPQARRSLDQYAQQFQHGILRPESDVLRIELQMRGGEPEAAKARASRFLSASPNHPLCERVRALIATR